MASAKCGAVQSDSQGWLDFVIDDNNVGASHVRQAGSTDAVRHDRIQVLAKRLDDALSAVQSVRLIKMDVEGHELPCLRGLTAIIQRDSPCIVFEQHVADFSGGSSPVINELKALGYRQFFAVQRVPAAGRGGVGSQLWSAVRAAVQGFGIEAVEKEDFEPSFYEMIIAVR